MIFYRQHFSGFHTFMAIIMLESFTLMSSTSFDVYWILGAQCAKLGQIVRNPRLANLALMHNRAKLHLHDQKHKSKQS
jgi:hypothetical protein